MRLISNVAEMKEHPFVYRMSLMYVLPLEIETLPSRRQFKDKLRLFSVTTVRLSTLLDLDFGQTGRTLRNRLIVVFLIYPGH